MIRLILIIAIVVAIVIVLKQVKNTPPAQRKKLYLKLTIGLSAAVVVLLALTGRIHWIGGLIAASVPLLRSALPHVLQHLPFLRKHFSQQTHNDQQAPPASTVDLSVEQAYQILGLTADADTDAVIAAHRKLIQKMHPDRGGNDYLAAQINQAKDILLKHLA
ncbi:DnaJ domain-containing protein [Dasania marina]|uniref:DnaJ domain-containing protein n=1 Tax=Dasania marina TaxID=471499 RepID=UPI0030DA0EAA|tara:strand:+ start:35079 stop:35564 length:486 start_codon:yes stop_codon:yes gene_type:complete